jgi:transcriptional regulator with XRE-family HTH domain
MYKEMGEFLKTNRVKAGLTQRDVADKLGYATPQFISNWERGISMPPIKALKRLGEMYLISAEDLLEKTVEVANAAVTADLKKKFKASR